MFAIAAVLSIAAQQQQFVVKVPQLDKVAVIKSPQVNLRQQPNANSPKLMERWDYDFREVDYGLKSTGEATANPLFLEVSDVYPVIAEQGEWIQLGYYGHPWIMKKFCELVDFASLKIQSPQYGVPLPYGIPLMKGSGAYSNLVFCFDGDEMNGFNLSVGTALDGIQYYVNTLPFGSGPGESMRPTQIRCNMEDGYAVLYHGADIATISATVDNFITCIDFSKLTDKQYAYLVKKLLPKDSNTTSMKFTLADGRKCEWNFDWANDKTPYKTITFMGE